MNRSKVQYLLNICMALVLLWGCRADTPAGKTNRPASNDLLLEQLTSVDESERFTALKKALHQVESFSRDDIERTLTVLRKKNVSTLIYLYRKSQNEKLYHLNPTAKMALENSQGSFPNIAYYYAKVKPSTGLEELFRLYEHFPKMRMAISLSIGEIKRDEAYNYLLSRARSEKRSGKHILALLCGLKRTARPLRTDNVLSFLNQKMEREEVIALSEIPVDISHAQLKTLWKSKGHKQSYAIQFVLGDPTKHFDTLRWIVGQLEQAGETDTIRQLMLSDGMRDVTQTELKQYREKMLKRLERSGV